MSNQQPSEIVKSQMEDGLPLEDYDSFSATQIVRKLPQLSAMQVEKLYRYEKAHKKRRRLLRHFEDRIGSAAATATSGREDRRRAKRGPGRAREHVWARARERIRHQARRDRSGE